MAKYYRCFEYNNVRLSIRRIFYEQLATKITNSLPLASDVTWWELPSSIPRAVICVALPFFEIKTKTDDLRIPWLHLKPRTCDEVWSTPGISEDVQRRVSREESDIWKGRLNCAVACQPIGCEYFWRWLGWESFPQAPQYRSGVMEML